MLLFRRLAIYGKIIIFSKEENKVLRIFSIFFFNFQTPDVIISPPAEELFGETPDLSHVETFGIPENKVVIDKHTIRSINSNLRYTYSTNLINLLSFCVCKYQLFKFQFFLPNSL